MTENSQKTPMEVAEWKARVRDGEIPSNIILHKEYANFFKSLSEDQPESRLVEFVLNTGGADRYNDTIKGGGWDLENYKKNPVVLWHHNQSALAGPGVMPHGGLPLAKGTNLEVVGDALHGAADFYEEGGDDPSEAAKFIDTVYQMVKGGYLNAVSVGFAPKKYIENEERGGHDFLEQELLEFSVVPIPADSNALRKAMESDIDITPIREWAVKTLESGTDIVVPRKNLEAVVKGLGYGRGIKFFDLAPTEIKKAVRARVSENNELYISELEDQIAEQAAIITSLGEVVDEQGVQVEHLEETISTMVLSSFEALDESLDGEIVVEDPGAEAETVTHTGWIESLALESGDLEEPSDEGTLILRVVDNEDDTSTSEGEDVFRFDPEDLTRAIEKRFSMQIDGLKQLFTNTTGQVL